MTQFFSFEIIEKNEELIKINVGCFNYFLPSDFLDGRNLSLSSYFANTKSHTAGF